MQAKNAVAVVGAGNSRFGDRIDVNLSDLFAEAFVEALDSVDKGLDPREIGEFFIGSLSSSGEQIGLSASLLAEYVGKRGVPAMRVEAACASGGYALRAGIMSIIAGANDVVVVGGVEKMRDVSGPQARLWLGVSSDTRWERWHGLTFPGIFALQATRHMHEYGTTREQLAYIAVKNHSNGAENPKAHFRRKVTVETVLNSPFVAYPLTLFDCCPTSDGAAVAILCRADIAKNFTDTPIYVSGFGAATDCVAAFDRESLTHFDSAIIASRQAYKMAGLEPKDIDLVELHDCFTISELVLTEDLGFCEKGEGGKFIEEGNTQIGGKVAVNPSGGLKAKGHPIGATGVGQVYEIFHQLRGDVEKRSRQVPGAEVGMAHIQGGFGVAATVHIFTRG